jgi:hypothetical protein
VQHQLFHKAKNAEVLPGFALIGQQLVGNFDGNPFPPAAHLHQEYKNIIELNKQKLTRYIQKRYEIDPQPNSTLFLPPLADDTSITCFTTLSSRYILHWT